MNHVTRWLAEIGLPHLADTFDEAQIEFDTLALLSDQDMRELGIPMGPRRNQSNQQRRLIHLRRWDGQIWLEDGPLERDPRRAVGSIGIGPLRTER